MLAGIRVYAVTERREKETEGERERGMNHP